MNDPNDTEVRRIPVVGIGASAGGIEALQGFFEAIPEDLGLAYVVIVHLAPDRDSELPDILGRSTRMPVTQVGDSDTSALAPNHVYVIAPDRKLEISDTSIGASRFDEPRGQRAAIDLFFRSLAASHGDGFAIVLSGSGADGAIGARAVKEAGGVVLVQDPREAGHESMPRAVISTGCADVVLPARELPRRLVELVSNKARVAKLLDTGETGPEIGASDETQFRQILDLLKSRTGHDFSKYKRTTILRRLGRRMQLSHQPGFGEYLSYIREHPEEVHALFDDLLISVTTFFRDPEAWEALRTQVVVPLVERPDADQTIRCWVPGCSTGEEAYSLAILFREALEERRLERDVVVFASDVDEGALATAREGLFPSSISADVSEARLERFFRPQHDHYRIAADVRDCVVFASHSLMRDPPFSRLDLISCRNLLIYLDRELQEQVLRVFQYACRESGYLFLGISESADTELFRPVDKKHRIFQIRESAGNGRAVPAELLAVPRTVRAEPPPRKPPGRPMPGGADVHADALEKLAPPSLVVDEHWEVQHMSESAARYLQQRGGVPARAITDLARPELRDELHSVLHQAFGEKEYRLSRFLPVGFNGTQRLVGMLVQCCVPDDGGRPYALVTFLEAGEATGEEPAPDQEPTNELVRSLRERLRQAEQRADALRDDHDVANEDLRAANEELQSLNEEYRSTTEELETSKEELQSINEELQTVNQELQGKLEEVSRAHNDLENLMAATDIATLFLDRDLRINRFTPRLADIYNITSQDIGRSISDFTHTLDYDGLEADARRVLADLAPIRREAGSRDGRAFVVRLRPYRTQEDGIEGVVLTLVDVTELKHAEQVLSESEERFRALVEASAQIVWTTEPDGRITGDSPSWRAYTGQALDQWKAENGWLDAVHPDDRAMAETAWCRSVESGTPLTNEFRIFHAPSGSYRWTNVRGVPLRSPDGAVRGWVGMNIDVNERREAVETLRQEDVHKDEFLAMLGHELRNPLAAIRNSLEVLSTTGARGGDDPSGRAWGVIDRQSRHIDRLVNDLLDVTRIKRGKLALSRSSIELGECIRDAVAAVQTELDAKRLELELDVPEQPVRLEADPERLIQILDNLLRNAIGYTDAGGRIGLRARGRGDHAEIRVSDTGIGFTPDEAEGLFEPYYQSDNGRRTGGLGLGLTLAKRLTELHGGRIELHSEGRGRGSEFTITLPCGRADEPAAENTVDEPLPAPRRVLVIDDETDVADSFAIMLESLGQEVRVAYSGGGGLALAREQRPDVVFLDLSMPDMTGWEIAHRLRADFGAEEMALVALTGYGKEQATSRDASFEHHLLKPAALDAIVELLNALCAHG